MYNKKRFAKNKTLKKTKYVAKKKEDKLQNIVLTKLTRRVHALERLPEIKNFTENSGLLSVTSSGSWYNAFTKNLVYGDNDNQRIGDVVTMKSIHIKGSININTLTSAAFVRLILVRYKQNFANYNPAAGDLLATNDFRSFYNTETQKDEFTILFDKTYSLVQGTNSAQQQIKIHKNLHNARCKWDSGLVNNAAADGHIAMYLISDQPSYYPFVNFTHVFYFTDA